MGAFTNSALLTLSAKLTSWLFFIAFPIQSRQTPPTTPRSIAGLTKIMASGQDEVSAAPRVEPLDKLTYIQEWRNRSNYTQYTPGPIQLTVIKDLYSMTIDLWRRILLASLRSGSQDKPHNMTDDCFQTLHLWGMGHGVLDGDLDSCLQSSKELYDSVMSLLVSIAELLFNGQRLSIFS
jgi:hypothetical protein